MTSSSPKNGSFPPASAKIAVRAGVPLRMPLDLEARIRPATERHTLKGMFFRRVVDIARAAGVTAQSAGLRYPVGADRYVAFSDYPVADYFRWAAATASAIHPQVPLSEGLRRVAHRDFDEFAKSRVGGITLAFTGGAKGTLAKSGLMYSQVMKGVGVESFATHDGVVIRYRNYAGPVEIYPVGTIEGTCNHFGAPYEIEIDVKSPQDADYFVKVDA